MAVGFRSNYSDFFSSSALPVLAEVFRHNLDRMPPLRDKLFKTISHDRDIYQVTELHDLPLHTTVAEGQDFTFFRPNQGANKTFSVVKHGLGIAFTDETIKDGKFDFMADTIAKMAQSARDTQEISAIQIFNNGFTTETTADGLSVFNTAHTLPSGITFANKPTTDTALSWTSLDAAMTAFQSNFVNDAGTPIYTRPQILLVSPSNRTTAMELVGSRDKPNTADRAMNALYEDNLQVIVSPHLTSTTAWFLLARPEQTGLRLIKREGLSFKTTVVDASEELRVKSRYREVLGVTHPYGMYGNKGV